VKRNLARNVHPTQSQIQRAEYIDQIAPFPSNYLVFVGKIIFTLLFFFFLMQTSY
jgi:hypothetical protein